MLILLEAMIKWNPNDSELSDSSENNLKSVTSQTRGFYIIKQFQPVLKQIIFHNYFVIHIHQLIFIILMIANTFFFLSG